MGRDTLNEKWRLSDKVIAYPVGDEIVILHLETGVYYRLDAIGSLLWEGIKNDRSPTEICDIILAQYEVDRKTIEQDLQRFVDELAEAGIINRR